MPYLFCIRYIQACRHIRSFALSIFFPFLHLSWPLYAENIYNENNHKRVCSHKHRYTLDLCREVGREWDGCGERGNGFEFSVFPMHTHLWAYRQHTKTKFSTTCFPRNHKKCLYLSQGVIWSGFFCYIALCPVLVFCFKCHIFYLLFMVIFINTSFIYTAR